MIPRNQVIAQSAYQSIVSINDTEDQKKGEDAEEQKKKREALIKNYATIAHKLPTMILQNGLVQATGFLLAKSATEKAHAEILDHLLKAFQSIDDDFKNVKGGQEFHEKIIASDLTKIMRYTREALDISGWLRRYVQGILKRGPTGETQEQKVTQGGES